MRLLTLALLLAAVPALAAPRPSKKEAVAAAREWMLSFDKEGADPLGLTGEPFLYDDGSDCAKEATAKAQLACLQQNNVYEVGDCDFGKLEVTSDAGFKAWQRFSDHDQIAKHRTELAARAPDHLFVHFRRATNGGDWEIALAVRGGKPARVDAFVANYLPDYGMYPSRQKASDFARKWVNQVLAGKAPATKAPLYLGGLKAANDACPESQVVEDEKDLPGVMPCLRGALAAAVKQPKGMPFVEIDDPASLTRGADAGAFAAAYPEINRREDGSRFMLSHLPGAKGRPARLLVFVDGPDDSLSVSGVVFVP